MADKFKRYGVPVRLENTPIFKRILQKMMNKVSGGTAGDFAALDADGNVVDSGKSASDFAPSAENGYVERQISTFGSRVYVFDTNGDKSIQLSTSSAGNSIVQRTSAGKVVCTDPESDNQAATKRYVDAAIAALKAELTQ